MRRVVCLVVAAAAVAACAPDGGVARTGSVAATADHDTAAPSTDPPSTADTSTGDTSTDVPSPDPDVPGAITLEPPPSDDHPVPVDPEVRIGTLMNGLTYYVRRNTNPGGWVELRLAIDAGSVHEEPDQSGVAHFLEHMLFNGTASYPENKLVEVLRGFGAQFGADINAYTRYDETVYQLTVPAHEGTVAVAVDVLSEWLTQATIDVDEVERERGVVLDEWRVRTQTGSGRTFAAIADLFLSGTSYEGRLPIGDRDSIATMDAARLRRFYEDWYRPDNAAIVAVGDLDVDATVRLIERRFGDVRSRDGAEPDRRVVPASTPAARVHADPEQGTAVVELTLPAAAAPGGPDAPRGTHGMRLALLDRLVFDILARRLQNDVSSGEAPFDSASVDSNSHVRLLDAPSVLVEGPPRHVRQSLEAVVTEFRRAEIHGFTEAELDEAAARVEATIASEYAGRHTRQDSVYADWYVDHFLRGAPIPDAEIAHELRMTLLGEVTVGNLNWRLHDRLGGAAPHVLIIGPDDADLPSVTEALDTVGRLLASEPPPRPPAAPLPDTLMERPAPVEEVASPTLVGPDQFVPFLDPTTFEFPNGATVTWNDTPIEDGLVRFAARSPGGCAALDPEGAANALITPAVVTSSGVGDLDQAALDRFLAGTDVTVWARIGPYHDEIVGEVATADAETLFQLLHLYFTRPRVDQQAYASELTSWEPLVMRPQSDPQYSGLDALVDLRYGGHPCFTLVPSIEQWEALDPGAVERVWRERTADVADWDFVLSGDLDGVDVEDLARSYIGSLAGSGTDGTPPDITPAPPAGPETSELAIGSGDTGTVTISFVGPSPEFHAEARVLADLTSEIVTDRLTRQLREELGESYSPFAWVSLDDEPDPTVATFVSVSGSPDRLAAIAELAHVTLAELRDGGPTDPELAAATAVIREQYALYYNDEIIEELLATLTPPIHGLAWLEHRSVVLESLDAADVRRFLTDHAPAEAYVQVTVRPG